MEKQECKIPDEPESNCESDCEKAKDMVVVENKYAITFEKEYKEKCGPKMRILQAPTPAEKPDSELDDCERLKKNIDFQDLLKAKLKANAKDVCKCKNEPVDPVKECHTCKDVEEEYMKLQNEISDLSEKQYTGEMDEKT